MTDRPNDQERSKCRRSRKAKRYRQLATVSLLYLSLAVGVVTIRVYHEQLESQPVDLSVSRDTGYSRSKRDVHEEIGIELNCTPRSVDQFPPNFFSLKDTQNGAVFVNILLALYMFAALAVVCDDYFVISLEFLCKGLGLQEDVAGATFMAAGSSAPELFTSIIGVFIAKSDVGVGTIVGSAIFNILFIVGVCGLFAGMTVYVLCGSAVFHILFIVGVCGLFCRNAVFNILFIVGVCRLFAGMTIQLTWWPLLRDCFVYVLAIVAMIVVIYDGEVHWYEGLVLVVMYILYIVLMYFNRRLEEKAYAITGLVMSQWKPGIQEREAEEKQRLIDKNEPIMRYSIEDSTHDEANESRFGGLTMSATESQELVKVEKEDELESPWDIPSGFLLRVFWVAMVPIKCLLWLTVPDCRKPGIWQKLYMLTFFMSVVWIAAFSYLMVWMVTITGDALNIPDTVMGLTLLAAGTSVPDCLSSVLVAREGLGDMAVSNSIGSNVFDILICLGLPWLINSIVNPGSVVTISSGGLLYSSITLLSTVVFIVAAIHVNKWRLTKPFGCLCLVIYVGVISLACLYELNIFGDFNPPACPRS